MILRCSICKEMKPETEFYKDKSRKKTGRRSHCKPCALVHHRAYVAANKDRIQAKWRAYMQTPEGRRKQSDYHRTQMYGVSASSFEELLKKQDYRCAICESPLLRDKQTTLDHDHSNGRIRGVLCSKCNFLIGLAGESEEVLAAAIAYIRRYKITVVA